MAKTQKKRKRRLLFEDLSPQTKQAIWAIFFAIVALIFTISLISSATGALGTITKTTLTWLFGSGAILAPIACTFYAITFLRPNEGERVSSSKIIGTTLLLLLPLAGLDLYQAEFGGQVGRVLGTPLSGLFGNIIAIIIVVASMLVGILLIFNTNLALPKIFTWRKDKEGETAEIDALETELNEAEEEKSPEETEVEALLEGEEKPAKKSVAQKLGLAKGDDFVVSSFSGPYDPPPLSLLQKDRGKVKVGDVKGNANIIKRTLKNFNIEVEMDEVSIGPSVTRYSLKPAESVRISRIVGLQNNLELALAASPIRIEAPIPGRSLVGIEVPNTAKAIVGLASLLTSPEYTDSPFPLLVALGRDITGRSNFTNLAKMPHGLIAGTTGSGKSVTIHTIVTSLLFRNSPEQLRFIMVDPKRVELTLYKDIPHLLTPVITNAKKAILSLKWAIKEMERRYDILESEQVRDIGSYHENVYAPAKEAAAKAAADKTEDDTGELPETLPYIVIVMDELADLMQAYPRELEASIVRLAQMSRAVGIHLLLATQRPSVNVITGLIKANIPSRIALQVASQIDSRTILDQSGAEKLIGAGDMLFLSSELAKPIRLQSAFVSEAELKKVVGYLKKQAAAGEFDDIDLESKEGAGNPEAFFNATLDDEDDLYQDAKEAVLEAGKASTSYLQRKLRIGYSRAARLIDLLEERGVIGSADGAKPRTILDPKAAPDA